MTNADNTIVLTKILASPSASPVYFLPISKTFFSNNSAELGFSDGIPSKYDQMTEGEAVALAKLPADIIGAYFEAVGKIFTAFSTSDKNETTALADEYKLELEKNKFKLCMNALKAKKTAEELETLGCG